MPKLVPHQIHSETVDCFAYSLITPMIDYFSPPSFSVLTRRVCTRCWDVSLQSIFADDEDSCFETSSMISFKSLAVALLCRIA